MLFAQCPPPQKFFLSRFVFYFRALPTLFPVKKDQKSRINLEWTAEKRNRKTGDENVGKLTLLWASRCVRTNLLWVLSIVRGTVRLPKWPSSKLTFVLIFLSQNHRSGSQITILTTYTATQPLITAVYTLLSNIVLKLWKVPSYTSEMVDAVSEN